MPIKEAAQSYVNNLLGTLDNKRSQADAVISEIKKTAKVIDGVPYLSPISSTGLTPTPISTKDFAKLLNDVYPDIDPVEINESASVITDTSLTACPTTPATINPRFSKDEIEKVVADTATECETRGVQSNILQGVPLADAVKALCNITPPVIAQPAAFPPVISLPVTGAASLPNDGNSPLATTVEPKDSLQKPNKSIVVLRDLSPIAVKGSKTVLVTPLKKIGDRVNCGDPLMNVGTGTVLCPVKDGVVKKIYVSGEAKKKDKLILIEESSTDDVINKTIEKATKISEKLNELTQLKGELGKLEPVLWTKKILAGIYEGQLQGYSAYYTSFSDLIKQRDELNAEFVKNKSDVQKLLGNTLKFNTSAVVGTGTTTSYTPPSQQAIDEADKIVVKQKKLLTDIGVINSQLDALRKTQPTYFAIEGGTEVLGAAEKTTNPLDIEYKLVPFNPGQRSKPTLRQIDVLGKLSNIVLTFTNNFLILNKFTPDTWKTLKAPTGQIDLDINQPNFFSWSELLPGSQAFETIFRLGGYLGLTTVVLKGAMHQTKKDFYDSIAKISDSITAGNPIDDKTQQALGDVRINERLLPAKLASVANQTYDQIVAFSKQFGYLQIYQDSAFILPGTDKTTALTKLRNDTKDSFDKDYVLYLDILKKIEIAEALIDNFPIELEQSLTGGCIIKDMSAPSAGIVDNDKVNLYQWPKSKDPLPVENINFRGNPQPNSPAVTEFSYWQKYCQQATTVNLLPSFWPVGLLIPTPGGLIKIPLPIIWTPITVIPTPLCVIVIGLAICGICPAPFIYIVNPGWPFPIGMAGPGQSWHLTGIRGPAKISGTTESKVLAAIPAITTNLKYTVKGVQKTQAVTIDAAPYLTKILPFIKDDLPSYERLSLGNLPYSLYLTSWCSAGKKTMGFFENP